MQELDHHDRVESPNRQPDAREITKRIQQLRDRQENYQQ
jgi:hypothetical protein